MSAHVAPSADRGGFSLVEVVVSMMIFTYGVLGLAGTTLLVVRQVDIAEAYTERTAVVQSAIERVRAESFDTYLVGTDTIGAFVVQWETWAQDSRTKALRVVTTGPGLSSAGGPATVMLNVADTIEYRMVRP